MRKSILVISSLLFIGIFFSFQTKEKKVMLENKKEILIKELEKEESLNERLKKTLELKQIYEEEKNWKKVVDCYNKLYFLRSSFTEAYPDNSKAIAIANKQLSVNDIETATAYQIRGEYFEPINSDSAIFYSKKAIIGLKYNKEWEELAWINLLIGSIYYQKEDQKNVEPYLFAAEKLVEKHKLSNEILHIVYNLLGAYYYSTTTDVEKTINATQRSLKLFTHIEGKTLEDSINLATTYSNLSVYFKNKKQFFRALNYIEQAIDIQEKITKKGAQQALFLENYGRLLYKIGNKRQGIDKIKEALFLNTHEKDEEERKSMNIIIYRRLGNLYAEKGELDSARLYIEKAITLNKKKDQSIKLEKVHLAEIFQRQGNYSKALEILKPYAYQNVSIDDWVKKVEFTALAPIDYLLTIHKVHNIMGRAYHAVQDYTKALESYQKAILINCPNFTDSTNLLSNPIESSPYFPEFLIDALENKAITLRAINTTTSLKAAFEANQLAIKWTEKIRQEFASDIEKVQLNKTASSLYDAALDIAYQIYVTTQDSSYIKEAFVIAEKQKGILLLESLIKDKGKTVLNVPESLLKREQELRADVAFYKQKILESTQQQDEVKQRMYKNYYNNFNIQLSNLKDTLSTYYQAYYEASYDTSIVNIEQVQQELLTNQKALIEYTSTDSFYYAFVIKKDNNHFIQLPKTTASNQLLKQLQVYIRSSDAVRNNAQVLFTEFTKTNHNVYQYFFEPLKQFLPEDIEEIVVVPDGLLNFLPFEVLLPQPITTSNIDFINLPYLIRKYQFNYGYSSSLLLKNKQQYKDKKPNNRILAFAPNYKTITASTQQRSITAELFRDSNTQLLGTSKEVQEIATLFDGKFHFDETATKENFQKEIEQYGILHLAMHGKSDTKNPDYAYLVFSDVNSEDEEEHLLRHYEIVNLPTQAQLAVLSACETGLGKELEGEGIMSLGRGFMYAGVPSVVMSLWKMNDQSTSELMPMFYDNLAKGMDKDKALHQAKIDYLENTTMKKAFPFYWAGFISLGDTHPIKQPISYTFLWWIMGGCLMVFLLLYKTPILNMLS